MVFFIVSYLFWQHCMQPQEVQYQGFGFLSQICVQNIFSGPKMKRIVLCYDRIKGTWLGCNGTKQRVHALHGTLGPSPPMEKNSLHWCWQWVNDLIFFLQIIDLNGTRCGLRNDLKRKRDLFGKFGTHLFPLMHGKAGFP